ncbi:MAG TPA: GGDEF domain-containing protein [Polyangiaceae bacterium]|nr:GGDEF domain-containing protein [Polyangiaceae bacterium]
MLPTIPPAPALKDERRIRFVVWVVVSFIVTIDACIATPLGLTWLYFGPLALAALRLPQKESIALAAICAAASFLFGPLGDPLGVHTVTLEVSARVQGVAGFGTAAVAYVGLGFVLHRFGRQQRIIRGLRHASESDPLTGLANRRGLDLFLRQHQGEPGAILVVDLDHFKRVNDTHGHAAGDAVLIELGRRLQQVTRASDIAARTGGEEFALVLPGAPEGVAQRVGNDVCKIVRRAPFPIEGGELAITASVGAAAGSLSAALIERADQAVYRSKQAGRDQLSLA